MAYLVYYAVRSHVIVQASQLKDGYSFLTSNLLKHGMQYTIQAGPTNAIATNDR